MRTVLLAVSLSLGVVSASAGCDAFRALSQENFEKIDAIRSECEEEFGVRPNVKVNMDYWRTNVGVAFSEPPAGDREAIEARVEAIVRQHFPDATNVVVAM